METFKGFYDSFDEALIALDHLSKERINDWEWAQIVINAGDSIKKYNRDRSEKDWTYWEKWQEVKE